MGLLHLYMHISVCLRILCVFFIEKLQIKSAVKPAVKKDFACSERFLAKSAVKACGDLATLTRELSN